MDDTNRKCVSEIGLELICVNKNILAIQLQSNAIRNYFVSAIAALRFLLVGRTKNTTQ